MTNIYVITMINTDEKYVLDEMKSWDLTMTKYCVLRTI